MGREDKRSKILDAARVVISSRGYRAATVQNILDEAHVARATFYKYFPDKRRVFADLVRSFLMTLYETARDYMLVETEDPEVLTERVRLSLSMFYRLFLDNREVISVYFREGFTYDPVLYAIWDDFDRRMTWLLAEMIGRGIRSGTFRPVDTGLVARALLMVFLQVPYRDILGSGMTVIDVDSMAEEMARFAVNGLVGTI